MADSPFDKLQESERREWRESAVTHAFLATLAGYRKEIADGAIETIKSDRAVLGSTLNTVGGELRCLDYVLLVATRERIYE